MKYHHVVAAAVELRDGVDDDLGLLVQIRDDDDHAAAAEELRDLPHRWTELRRGAEVRLAEDVGSRLEGLGGFHVLDRLVERLQDRPQMLRRWRHVRRYFAIDSDEADAIAL